MALAALRDACEDTRDDRPGGTIKDSTLQTVLTESMIGQPYLLWR